jgi:glycosyltransferase involved in cell wall biosynthesis
MEDIVHSELAREYDFEIFERAPTTPPGGFLKRNLFRIKRVLRFFKMVRIGNYCFIHIQSADPAFMQTTVFIFLARVAGAKVLLHHHGTDWDSFYPDVPWHQKLVTKFGIWMASRILVLYEMWVEHIKEICATADVRVLKNRVQKQDPPDLDLVERTRRSLQLNQNDFVVLTIGSVGRRKGYFEILESIPRIVAQDDSVRFVFVGGEEKPGEMAHVLEIVDREGLRRWVRVADERDRKDVPLFLEIADLFLLPSFYEGVPITIIEAMRSGVPVISTPVAGIPELIEDGVSGMLVRPGASDEIADVVLLLRRDDALRRKLAEGGKAAFDEKFEFSKGIAELRELYETM